MARGALAGVFGFSFAVLEPEKRVARAHRPAPAERAKIAVESRARAAAPPAHKHHLNGEIASAVFAADLLANKKVKPFGVSGEFSAQIGLAIVPETSDGAAVALAKPVRNDFL